jgi:hypothetical protein
MVSKKVSLAVDPRFFNEVFERERRKQQKKIGVPNLSQANFTKMIKGFQIREPRQDFSHFNTKIVRKRNVKI